MADEGRGEQPSGTAATRRRPRRGSCRSRRRPIAPWYASEIDFQRHLEHNLDTVAEHRRRVSVTLLTDRRHGHQAYRTLCYRHTGLEVPGRRDRVPVEVQFLEDPAYETYGLPAADYPRVVADPGLPSKHRMPDDALCLYYPRDPDDRRWQHTDGLASLFEIIRDHLQYENHWRSTGGFGDPSGNGQGTWLGDEAPHGFTEDDSR